MMAPCVYRLNPQLSAHPLFTLRSVTNAPGGRPMHTTAYNRRAAHTADRASDPLARPEELHTAAPRVFGFPPFLADTGLAHRHHTPRLGVAEATQLTPRRI